MHNQGRFCSSFFGKSYKKRTNSADIAVSMSSPDWLLIRGEYLLQGYTVSCAPTCNFVIVHMMCMTKADLFRQKLTQHHMYWNVMDLIFGIFFRYILNWLCFFLNSRNFYQNGRGLRANVHYAPYYSELIFYWSAFSFRAPTSVCRICFNRLTKWCSSFSCLTIVVYMDVCIECLYCINASFSRRLVAIPNRH